MVMDLLVESALKASREGSINEPLFNQALIKVLGVGGGGNNMGNWLFKKGVKGAEVILANTDQIQLNASGFNMSFLTSFKFLDWPNANIIFTKAVSVVISPT